MTYGSEVEVMRALGIGSWRNLSKDRFLQFLAAMPDIDHEVAIRIVGQLPEIRTLAQAVLGDAAKAHEVTLKANARSQELVHQVHAGQQAILRAELDKDHLSPEQWMRLLDELRHVLDSAVETSIRNQRFLADESDKRLGVAVAAAGALAMFLLAATTSRYKPRISAGRVLIS